MSDGDSIAQVAVVILLLLLAVPALATAYDYAGTPIEYSEEVTIDYDNTSEVSESSTLEGYGEDPTITTDGVELTEGNDYDWDADEGIINWHNTEASGNGDTAVIDYAAYQRTEETEMAWTIISPLMALFGLFGFIVSARALWSYTAEVWDLV